MLVRNTDEELNLAVCDIKILILILTLRPNTKFPDTYIHSIHGLIWSTGLLVRI